MPNPIDLFPIRLQRLLLLTLGLGLTACANTGVVPSLEAGVIENPATGIAVRIAQVDDRRAFQDYAGRKFVPTLTKDAKDPERRARVIGRATTRAGRGTPAANVFLAPGLSVSSLVSDAVGRALRASDFRVLEEGNAGYDDAIGLRLVIEQLWMMQNPPSQPPMVAIEMRVRVAGPLPGLERGAVIEVLKRVNAGGFSRAMWRIALERGLDGFTEATETELAHVRKAIDEMPAAELAAAGLSMLRAEPLPPDGSVEFGRYYLLAIAIEDYESLPRLKTPVADARAVAALLEQGYGFETELLLNARRADLIRAFSSYREKVGPGDNLLIYYAGHGWNDEEADLGYWLPADATPDDETNWVSNSKITSILRAMEAKHVMVVSDSCYSGTLTRGIQVTRRGPDYLERLAERRTRVALASGGNEPVEDGGGGGHSVFANAFLRALRENAGVLDATTLHAQIRTPIMRDAEQTPQFGPIRRARHEDGDFLFVREE